MSKKIGIKLADGSFYPILEEGNPDKKTLELTTVKDNQETVQVDLYRSELGTMDDAEYVDSLQVDKLSAHPNGEPTLSFDVKLDENNELSAEICDPESGKKSNVAINLVNRTQDERNAPANFEIAPETQVTESVSDEELNKFEMPEDVSLEEPSAEVPAQDAPAIEEPASEEPTVENIDIPASGGLLAAAAAKQAEESVETSEPAFAEPEISKEANTESDFTEPTVDEPTVESPVENSSDTSFEETPESITTETDSASDTDFSFDSLDLPKFDDMKPEQKPEVESTEEEPTSSFTEPVAVEDSPSQEKKPTETTDEIQSEELPDIDFNEQAPLETYDDIAHETVSLDKTSDDSTTVENDASKSDDNFFNLPDFDDEEFASTPDSATFAAESAEKESQETMSNDEIASMDFDSIVEHPSFDKEPITESGGLSFDNLYDKETIAGKSSFDDVAESKRTMKHVVICVICAAICIIATILVLFVVPSKLNLLTKNTSAKKAVETQPVVAEQKLPPPAQPQAPAAKENEIVVSKTPQVVPVVPPAPPKENKNITYKIRWGDTLWDISDAYYRNPWKYSKIANYNRIKNPDYIISGTTIVIPAE